MESLENRTVGDWRTKDDDLDKEGGMGSAYGGLVKHGKNIVLDFQN